VSIQDQVSKRFLILGLSSLSEEGGKLCVVVWLQSDERETNQELTLCVAETR
jgi:hypothetical protein